MKPELPRTTQAPRQGQLLQLNWIRGIAALLVVGYHCEVTMLMPKYFGVGTFPLFKAGHSGVQLFFVLSGFVIYLAHHRDPEGNGSAIARFVAKRFRRLYPSLWIVLVPLIILSFLGFSTRVPDGSDVILSLLILPVKEEVILATEWTLRHEILFYAMFAVFLWNRRIGFGLLIAWGLVGLPLARLCQTLSELGWSEDPSVKANWRGGLVSARGVGRGGGCGKCGRADRQRTKSSGSNTGVQFQ